MRISQIPQRQLHIARELPAALVEQIPEDRRLDAVVDEEGFHRHGKGIVVHGRGKSGPFEVVRRIGPHLGDGDGLRVDLENQCIPLAPEFVRDLFRHIEPPAVDAVARIAITIRVHPALGRMENVLLRPGVEIVAVRVITEFGQGEKSGPTRDAQFIPTRLRIVERLNGEPVGVGRLLAIDPDIAEREEVAPGMVEDAIDHHLDPAVVRLSDQLEEQLVRSRPLPRGGIIRFTAVANNLEVTLRIRPEIRINVME